MRSTKSSVLNWWIVYFFFWLSFFFLFGLWKLWYIITHDDSLLHLDKFIIEETYTHRTPRKTEFLGSHLSQKTQKHLNNKNPIKAYQCTSIVNENVWNFLFHFFISLFQYLYKCISCTERLPNNTQFPSSFFLLSLLHTPHTEDTQRAPWSEKQKCTLKF